AVVENTDARANGRAIVIERQIKQRDAGRNVPMPGDVIAIDPQTTIESDAPIYDPGILDEPSQLGQRTINRSRLQKIDTLAESLISPSDFDRSEIKSPR